MRRGETRLRIRRRRAFTLLEMMAVVFLTALVLSVAVSFYIDLSRASRAAVDKVRNARRAVAILDRVARDLEGTVLLVKPPERDPLEHPWLFLAEADDERSGAERVKFITRSRRPRATARVESDLVVASFVAEPDEDGEIVLWHAVTPHLPEALDRSFPRGGEGGARILSEGLARFGMRFLTEQGDWVARFDSSTLANSSQLPSVAEIELAFLVDTPSGEREEGRTFKRQVVLPLRPLDLDAELEAVADNGDGDGDADNGDAASSDDECISLFRCLSQNPSLGEGLDFKFTEDQLARCADDFGFSEEECR